MMGIGKSKLETVDHVDAVLDGFMWESFRSINSGRYKCDLIELETCMVVMSGPWRKDRAKAAFAAQDKLIRLLKGALPSGSV